MKTAGFRNSFGKEGKRRKAAMHLIPNLFTTGNLFCGVYAILSVFNANYFEAKVQHGSLGNCSNYSVHAWTVATSSDDADLSCSGHAFSSRDSLS